MSELRVNIGVMSLPELKRALQEQAQREGRTISNLSERLLTWAMRQLERAGDSQALVNWEARPPGKRRTGVAEAKGGGRCIYQQVTRQAEDFARTARKMAERPHEGANEQRASVSKKEARHTGRPRRRAHS
jgi:hypothetical protein